MKRWFAVGVAVAFIGGCQSPGPMIYKPGATKASTQLALDQCKIASFKEIPQNIATDVHGGYYNPGTLQCSGSGYGSATCYRVGAVNIPATSISYDVNQGVRDRYIQRCLEGKGFQVYDAPTCATKADRDRSKAATARGERPTCASGTLAE